MANFEALIAHEANHYNNPYSYSQPEFEDEWEMHEGSHYSNPYSQPEFEDEWEMPEGSHYSNPYSQPEFEDEWEVHEGNHYSNPYTNPEFEDEVAHYSNPYSNPEDEVGQILGATGQGEYESGGPDRFFGRIRRAIGKVAKMAAPLAKRLAPFATKALAGMIPGVGGIASQLVGQLLPQAEMEVAHMENQLLSMLAQEGEAEHPEVHGALMAELLAGQAVAAESEGEAEAMLAASLPLTIGFMHSQRAMLPITPVLVQANARLVRTFRQQGREGRELLRLLPAINRNTIAILRILSRSQRLTTPTAVRAMSAATKRLMSSPQRTQKAIQRNMAMQARATRTNQSRGTLPLRPTPRRQRTTV